MDHAIRRRRNAKLAHSSVRLGDLHALHRLGPVRSRQKLASDAVAVTLEVFFKLLHTHTVYTGRSAVGNHSRYCRFEVIRVTDGLHQPVTTCRAFSIRVRHAQRGPFTEGHRRFTPTLLRKGQQQLLVTGFLPCAVHEITSLLATPFTPLSTGDRSGLPLALRSNLYGYFHLSATDKPVQKCLETSTKFPNYYALC